MFHTYWPPERHLVDDPASQSPQPQGLVAGSGDDLEAPVLAISHSVLAAVIAVSRFNHGEVLPQGYHALVDLR